MFHRRTYLVAFATLCSFLFACGGSRHGSEAAPSEKADASTSSAEPTGPMRADAGDAPGPLPTGDGGSVPSVACVPSSAVMIYPKVGASVDDLQAPHGPGLVLMGGGTDVDAAFVWTHDAIAGAASTRAGDLIILRASGDNGYDAYAYALAPFHSVRTIVLGASATATDLACVAAAVSEAEAVFFAGGDQSRYVAWQGSPLIQAVQHVYDRGGVVGGTSAGCAILGEFVYDSLAAGSSNVATGDAIASPFESPITFTRGMLRFPPLAGVITDPHFHARDRMGRLAAFMARQHADGAVTRSPAAVLGIGVDEKNAVAIDQSGMVRLLQQAPGTGAAYFLRGEPPTQCEVGKPLIYRHLRVVRLDSSSQTFSLSTWCGDGPTYQLDVFGDAPPPYQPSNPYTPGADGTMCGP